MKEFLRIALYCFWAPPTFSGLIEYAALSAVLVIAFFILAAQSPRFVSHVAGWGMMYAFASTGVYMLRVWMAVLWPMIQEAVK